MLKRTFICKNLDSFCCKWILRMYAMHNAKCKIAIAPSLCQALKQLLWEPFSPVSWTEAFSVFTKMVLIGSNRTLADRTKPTFHGLCICKLNYVICVRVCVPLPLQLHNISASTEPQRSYGHWQAAAKA